MTLICSMCLLSCDTCYQYLDRVIFDPGPPHSVQPTCSPGMPVARQPIMSCVQCDWWTQNLLTATLRPDVVDSRCTVLQTVLSETGQDAGQ